MDDRRHERFGRYEVLAELGRGAMGVVYKARDPKINRLVAVKTINLSGQPADEEREYRERFHREAEAAGRLSHPGIVTIFDVGEEEDSHAPYIVMEFVGGQSLDRLLTNEPDHKLPMHTALQVAAEIAEALDCAHGQGVVHRDLKPANILITEQGNAKIADFGVAKLNLANATLAGRAMGTPAYMSPEQLNGEVVDGRSDIFSLGVILYTVLTGYRPFQGNSAMTVSFKVVNRQPIPASVLDTELPPGLDYIIGRAMAKDPAHRYQRGMELVLDLQELREGREPWSKAKQSAPTFAANQSEDEKAKVSAAKANVPAKATGGRAASAEHGLPMHLIKVLRHRAFSGALFVLGLLLIGLRIGYALWPQAIPLEAMPMPRMTPLAPELAPVAAQAKPVRVAAETARNSEPPVPKSRKQAHTLAVVPVSKKTTPVLQPMVAPAPVVQPPAMLEIEVDHKFAEASLSIWVDDRLALTRQLEATDKKRLGVFHHVEGHDFHAMEITPGKHLLRVEITSAPNIVGQSTVSGEFATGTEPKLHIQVSKTGEMVLNLQ